MAIFLYEKINNTQCWLIIKKNKIKIKNRNEFSKLPLAI